MHRPLAALALCALALPAHAATLALTPGWDNFSEPFNPAASSVAYTAGKGTLTVTFTLSGATPSKLYQVAIEFFGQCPAVPASFGPFPDHADQGCQPYTRQGNTASTSGTELGVVTTDASGNGSTRITVSGVASGNYALEFIARDGAGCNVFGGNGGACAVDFQSPGPDFTNTTIVTIR